MNKFTKFSLTLLVAGILSACGSSGGDNNAPAPSTPGTTNTTPSTNGGTSASTNNNGGSTNTNNNGGSSNANNGGVSNSSNSMGNAFRTTDGTAFEIPKAGTYDSTLVVDGKTLPVKITGVSSGGITNIPNINLNGTAYKNFAVSGTKFSQVKFGRIEDYVFAQGNVTPAANVPATGAATYVVDGVFIADGKTATPRDHILNVDFSDKTVRGNVAPEVSVEAKISGNAFEGNATYKGNNATLEGNFYGANVEEIGGAYGSSTFSGAFGGKKQ